MSRKARPDAQIKIKKLMLNEKIIQLWQLLQ
nr:MAG TPA: hypothetical protein [Microviridae sp.]